MIIPVILSGGSGTRLWPLSRTSLPKQLLAIADDRSMLQVTASRCADATLFGAPLIIAGAQHGDIIARQMAEAGWQDYQILLEPEGRNTAPAIALAAHAALASDAEALILVMPSDHVIADVSAFHAAIRTASAAAQQGYLVAFGIAPGHPETGYGYIELGEALALDESKTAGAAGGDAAGAALAIRQFVEKPDLARAQAYLAGGRHVWNGGIFLFKAQTLLDAMAHYAPDVADACAKAMADHQQDERFLYPEKTAFLSAPDISIDYAVMERSQHAAVVPVTMGWSDVGSWDALWSILPKDDAGNVSRGDTIALDCRNSLLRVDNGPMIAAYGIENLVIVSTGDSVLVVPQDKSQGVKQLVDQIKAQGLSLHRDHARQQKPWGASEILDLDAASITEKWVFEAGRALDWTIQTGAQESLLVISGQGHLMLNGENHGLTAGAHHSLAAGQRAILQAADHSGLTLLRVQWRSTAS